MVVGRALDVTGEQVACVWIGDNKIQLLKDVSYQKSDKTDYLGGYGILATAVSGNGGLIAGVDQYHKGFWWEAGEYSEIDSGESNGTLFQLGFVIGMSSDGDFAVGQNGFPGSRAIGRDASVSNTSFWLMDGTEGIWGGATAVSVVTGYGEHDKLDKAFKWTTSGVAWLGPFSSPETVSPTGQSTGADISGDGNYIVGNFNTDKGLLGYVWDVSEVTTEYPLVQDSVTILKQLDPEYAFHGGQALGVSSDGEIVVGVDQTRFGPRAVMWRKSANYAVTDLQTLVYPNAMVGFSVRSVSGISDDGRVIYGSGVNEAGQEEAYRLWLIPSWRNYPLLSNGVTADTGDLLGLVDVAGDPYIYIHSTSSWVYWPEESATPLGDWLWFAKP